MKVDLSWRTTESRCGCGCWNECLLGQKENSCLSVFLDARSHVEIHPLMEGYMGQIINNDGRAI